MHVSFHGFTVTVFFAVLVYVLQFFSHVAVINRHASVLKVFLPCAVPPWVTISARFAIFYDLEYANLDHHQQFDPTRHYAFLRRSEDQLLLVVCNFSDETAEMGVCIPEHAFTYLSIPEGSVRAKDLLTGRSLTISLHADGFTSVEVPANGAVCISVSMNQEK